MLHMHLASPVASLNRLESPDCCAQSQCDLASRPWRLSLCRPSIRVFTVALFLLGAVLGCVAGPLPLGSQAFPGCSAW